MTVPLRTVRLNAIDEKHRINLSADEQRAFVALLINPPPLAPAMARAKAHHKRLFGEQ